MAAISPTEMEPSEEIARTSTSQVGSRRRSSADRDRASRWATLNLEPDSEFGGSGRQEENGLNDEENLKWAALEKLPTYDRLRTAILEKMKGSKVYREEVDLRLLSGGEPQAQALIRKLFTISSPEEDNANFLRKLRGRLDKVGVQLPTVEVRYENYSLEAEAHIGGRAMPSLPNSMINTLEGILESLCIRVSKKSKIPILRDLSGIVKPGRLTLLLGPPGSGKTSFLRALAGKLDDDSLKVSGRVTYNGHEMTEFVPQKTSAYISQHDFHVPEMTVRETFNYSAKSQGVGTRYELMTELLQREKELGIKPDMDIDFYMKATAMQDLATSVVTEYTLKILSLEICSDIMIGNEMVRGISGGQKKRVTTGEMIVGPTRTLFMDEISTGLDSSTTYQIVKCLRDICHALDSTIVMSLLQPPPETFENFDDIILLADGQIVYQGEREKVLDFFEACGFKCPERKGVADFLQEVTSRKDQEQYWADKHAPYVFVSVEQFAKAFKHHSEGITLQKELAIPYDRNKSHKAALIRERYSVSTMQLFKINFEKEYLLMKRNSFVYFFRIFQVSLVGLLSMSVFFRTEMRRDNLADAQIYAAALFFGVIMIMFNGYAELAMTATRLPVFYKQRDLLFLPSWAFAIPRAVLSIPVSFYEAFLWVAITYYTTGFAPAASRFFQQLFLFFSMHQMAGSMFRFTASVARDPVIGNTLGTFILLVFFFLGGFLLPKDDVKPWWIWGYWISPLAYATNAVSVVEYLAPQWNKPAGVEDFGGNETLGKLYLRRAGLFTEDYWYWIGIGVLLGYALLFNTLFTLALTYLNPLQEDRAMMTKETLDEKVGASTGLLSRSASQNLPRSLSSKGAGTPDRTSFTIPENESAPKDGKGDEGHDKTFQVSRVSSSFARDSFTSDTERKVEKRGMILPFEPLSISFRDINYYVDMPAEMKQQGASEDKLQLLKGIYGAFRPGVLTALVGVSGAGKTTLMDVLAGRKTGGYIEGDIHIAGFPKVQETFARISGYVEQNDIHSPLLTVSESLTFSAWLRLHKSVDDTTKAKFVQEVMELVELTTLKNALVGLPAVSGLSTEQRKRLTIAVELVANPSIIFMDEPTSGLDARAAAIVMRTVRNTVDTGRTVVCTIHQPSIDIFEAFDELLLLKRGGRTIYAGPLGRRSHRLKEYFEAVPGAPKLKDGYNPATWMLEVSSVGVETKLGVDFADIYESSALFQRNKSLVEELSKPAPNAKDLWFPTQYSQSFFSQISSCVWKQRITYWRNPKFNNTRLVYTVVCGLAIGSIFWGVGRKRHTEIGLYSVMGSMYGSVVFLGVNNARQILPLVATERTVFYRERAAGMYSAIPYGIGQVLIEMPYSLFQSVLFGVLTYFMMHLEYDAGKFFWYLYYLYLTLLYFSYYGMMAVGLTPNQQVASIVATLFYGFFNLFSGFLIPYPSIPIWWKWYYWMCPLAYSLYGCVVSQFGDLHEELLMFDGSTTYIDVLIRERFGFKRSFLPLTSVMVIVFAIVFASIFMYTIARFNFQRR
ncbi:ATP-binding cassette, subfamily G (WHITE), member 2, PDR [Marchantia polymorpha subsp. ruderalis]|uniref:ABC transporter domain-containing protein n=2 Tax=Marchantia polymorpha TaxID=3197 RepID=A0AAF6AU57_MARPO|nr:hypothetical protein MARPO_0002s0337 [Marchantia polymorpha]BBM99977.1 hypothetical protein Mp_1g25350 [Marchantia polymorpha subsp. ruderalis]|eukprot:PTQ49902.1 hypothetical protein MARPO_0002s0337 [Marchantia polymorpha]